MSKEFTYASIVPLIGGETIAVQQSLDGQLPEYLLSYDPFRSNDEHLLNYYNYEVDYKVLGEGDPGKLPYVDIVNSVCPCAGLSSYSTSASADSATNDWMFKSTQHVLENIKPKVLWGENAPRLASKFGRPVVDKLRKIAEDNGYTMTLYRTKSVLHGLSQVRQRSFFFFWKGNEIPFFNWFKREMEPIEDLLSIPVDQNDPMSQLIVEDTPSEHPIYMRLLEKNGMNHQQYYETIDKTTPLLFELEPDDLLHIASDERVPELWQNRMKRIHHKLFVVKKAIMNHEVQLPKGKIGAFVCHMPYSMIHPYEDRHLTYREALRIMKMPEDFQLLNPRKNLNHICQNVPVTTALDMSNEVLETLRGNRDMEMGSFAIQNNENQKFDEIQSTPQPLSIFTE